MDDTDARGDQTDAKGEYGHNQSKGGPPSMTQSDFVNDCYNMKHKERGIAVIINNKNFKPQTGMGVRNGTDIDCENMYNLLTAMKFQDIRVLTDATTRTMQKELYNASNEDHSNFDCFVCVVLTHGEEGYVFGVDDKIALQDLVHPFKGHKCPSLAGKPKLFFIQACRGTQLDVGAEVADAFGEEAMEEEVMVRRIPTEADFLMAYSVVPGFYSWRNSSKGSWFIQAIVKVFTENWKKPRRMDILTMMTRVNKLVGVDFESNASNQSMTNKKQIPCITSMLTKDLFFD